MAETLSTPSMEDDTATLKKKPQSADDIKLFDWATALLKEGRARRRHWEGVWWENIAFYMGDFWVEWDIHKRRLVEPVKKPDHRVRMPINLAQPAVRTELAKLTKNRPIADVLARSSDEEDLNGAKVGDKMLNNYAERKFSMARVRRRCLNWVLTCGCGGILVDWDATALGEIDVFHNASGEPIFDPQLIEQYKHEYEQNNQKPTYKKIPMGEVIVKSVSPFQVVWDFSQLYIEDAWWCIYSDVVDVDEVYRRWGVHIDSDPEALPGVIENRLMSRFDLTGKLQARPVHVQKLAHVHQLWIKPGHPKFPDGLCLVFNKDTIIQKTAFDYGHGELPIHMMGHIPFPVSQYPLSILMQLKAPVLELSKSESQMIENRNLMGNPPWLIPKQLQISKEIQNRPGMRIEYNYMPNVPEPKPVQMPEIPKYVTDLIEILKGHIQDISGQSDTSQGNVPPGARSGVAIAYMQEEDDTRLGVTVQEYEEMYTGVARHMLRMFAEKYDTPRTVTIYGLNKQTEVYDFTGAMLAGADDVNIQAGSALPRSKAAKQQYILDLWDRKIEQDPRKVRQMLELSEGEPDEWEVDLDQAERENHLLKQGQDPGVQEWYNHPAHHYIHRNYMKGGDFQNQPPEIQQLFMQHDEEHTQMEQQQAAEMAANQAGGAAPPGAGGAPGAPAPPGSSVPAGANGQNNPQGPPSQFAASTTPRSLLESTPQ